MSECSTEVLFTRLPFRRTIDLSNRNNEERRNEAVSLEEH